MKKLDAIAYAIHYLHSNLGRDWKGIWPEEDCKLNRALQYCLCHAVDRLEAEFGEVTKKDVALLCEAWIMANHGKKHYWYYTVPVEDAVLENDRYVKSEWVRALVHKSQPEPHETK